MTIFLACLSTAALGVAIVAAFYSRGAVSAANRSAVAADRSATAAESVDRRARTPDLVVLLDTPAPAPIDRVIYRVRNDGPQDLSSLTIFRPQPTDRIIYPVGKTGEPGGWAENEITYAQLALTQELRFTLSCGTAEKLPEFRVRIECRAGDEVWELNELLPPPRQPRLSASDYL